MRRIKALIGRPEQIRCRQYQLYRQALRRTLTGLMLGLLLSAGMNFIAALPAEGPVNVNLTALLQGVSSAAYAEALDAPPAASANGGSVTPKIAKPAKKSRWWWPFGAKKPKPPTEDQIVNVGPRDTPASVGALLRVIRPVALPEGILESGFYEARLDAGRLTLMQRGQLRASLEVQAQDVTASPVVTLSPQTGKTIDVLRAYTELSPQGGQVRFVIEQGQRQALASQWYALAGGQAGQGVYSGLSHEAGQRSAF
ncbi:MAG: hypothetical protein VKJ06_08140 [Vampirovibrionales bacterium]|nr:hypothetical protein [Vampirovibrionales bacterium]